MILSSAVGDNGGYYHTSLSAVPTIFTNPLYGTTSDLDYAGQKPSNIVRVGNTAGTVKQIAISTDYGASWNQDYGAADYTAGGKVALSAQGDIVLWATGTGNGTMVSQYTNAFTVVSSLPSSGVVIASDKIVDNVFYAAAGSKFYLSSDGGKTFTASSAALGSSSTANDITVNVGVTGDVWVSTDAGLFHTTNNGTSWTAVSGFSNAYSISTGAAKTSGGYPSVFAFGTYSSTAGLYRSDDGGVNWNRIDDANHRFASISSNVVAGDPRTWGRVYVGTNGRGVFYGDDNGSGTVVSDPVNSRVNGYS